MNKSLHFAEPARKIPVVHETDLCVVGGSCTGVFAAVRAARLGAKVCVIESNGFFGGVATAGLVNIWHPLTDSSGKRKIIGGLTQEIIDRLNRRRAVLFRDPPTAHGAYNLNTEELKIELDELIREHGVRPFLHARFVSPILSDGLVQGIVIEDKSGRRAIRARFFIDATGDGDLLFRSGMRCDTWTDPQPPTVVALWEHFNRIKHKNPDFQLSDVVFDPRYPQALKRGFLWGTQLPGRPQAYMVAGTRAHHVDCTDADQLTEAEIECRRQVRAMMDILREHVPGGEEIILSNLSGTIGIRETRHPQCLYTLTGDDVLYGRDFPDAIACGTYGCDIHHSGKAGITMRYLDGTERYSEPGKPTVWSRWRDISEGVTPYYQIPFRSLVPRGAENVLLAGRLAGADRQAYGAIRVMVNCNQTGEAAGVAAALAAQSGGGIHEVDTRELRKLLCEGGSLLP